MNIVEAVDDSNLFMPFLGDDTTSWYNWLYALRVLYGLNVPKQGEAVVELATGRALNTMPEDGFRTALFLVGRRSGKSRIAALVGAYEAALAKNEYKLAKGERGVVAVCAPTVKQARVVKDYLRAIFEARMLAGEIVSETQNGFDLVCGNRIEILAGDWRTVRGYTLLAAIVDEAAFFGYEADARAKNDSELMRALKPSLATVNGRLICISSPYARRGWCYKQYKRNFGNPVGKVLLWNCTSRTMNPLLPQAVVDDAIAEDRAAALSEFMGEFRDDVDDYLPRTVIEKMVIKDRVYLPCRRANDHLAFVDLSGGREDEAAIAIGHREGRKAVVDFVCTYPPPFNPYTVICSMVNELRQYGIQRVTGDNYAAEFVAQAFKGNGIRYIRCNLNKSTLYAELLPRLCAGDVELPDKPALVDQFVNLERRTRSGGRDLIDHRHGCRDDMANAVAGLCQLVFKPILTVGALR